MFKVSGSEKSSIEDVMARSENKINGRLVEICCASTGVRGARIVPEFGMFSLISCKFNSLKILPMLPTTEQILKNLGTRQI